MASVYDNLEIRFADTDNPGTPSVIEAPKLVRWQGEYDASRTYDEGDGVSYNGSSYINIKNCIGFDPTDTVYWDIMARAGSTGTAGSAGATGSFITIPTNTAAAQCSLNGRLVLKTGTTQGTLKFGFGSALATSDSTLVAGSMIVVSKVA